jgi:hypothetical protein
MPRAAAGRATARREGRELVVHAKRPIIHLQRRRRVGAHEEHRTMKPPSATPKSRRSRRSRLLLSAIAVALVAAAAALLLAAGPSEQPMPAARAVHDHPSSHAPSSADRADVETLVAYNRSIELDGAQEAVREEALSALPAPCCAQFSAATCCCECNLARATWGLAKHLIASEGLDATAVRERVAAWHGSLNPAGFAGNACFTGGCNRAFAEDGCGGMEEGHLVF